MDQKFNQFLFNRGFGILPMSTPAAIISGRRYIANIKILHPETHEPSALEHNVVIDEFGRKFNPTTQLVDPSAPLRVSLLREIIYLGADYVITKC